MPTDNTFLNNGIVFPDRTPQPALYEVKKVYEYINFKSQGVNKYNELRVLVENLYDFTKLSDFDFVAVVKSEGNVLKTVPIEGIDADPHSSKLVRINLNDIDFQDNTEYFVEVSARLKSDDGILPKGFEVAHEQFLLDVKSGETSGKIDYGEPLKLDVTKNQVTISNQKVKVLFDKKEGRITSYVVDGTEYIKDGKGPLPNFWRAVTDNDFGNHMDEGNIEWKKASLFLEVDKIETNVKSEIAIDLKVTYTLPGVSTLYHSQYRFYGSGVISIINTLEETTYEGDIPRIGMRMQLPYEFSKMTYFGRGPWENYQDRNTSAFIDLYTSDVKDQYVPYIRPQENGYKTDVRWLALSNELGDGLLVVSEFMANSPGISALHMANEDFDVTSGLDYSGNSKAEKKYRVRGEELNKSKHTTDISEQDFVQLNIDMGQRGVGGDDSWWSKPQEEYLIKGNKLNGYSYWLIPYKQGNAELYFNLSKKYINSIMLRVFRANGKDYYR